MKFVTTPIYYVNDAPHIGHIYSTLLADVISRYHRLRGEKVFLTTGTDEHATKVVEAAKINNLSTDEWAKRNATAFAGAFQNYNIHFNDFIRTSESRHKDEVSKRVSELIETGDVYLGKYEGWYDSGQEEYVNETVAKQNSYHSAINKKPLMKRTEPCYYFRLSSYQNEIKSLIESDSIRIIPQSRKAEILSRINEGLNDVPCSRPKTEDWGVEIPGDSTQIVYVWIDALLNYLTTIDNDELRECWPPELHIVGKDILWFHAVIWPSMILALQNKKNNEWIKLPKAILAHGFWIRDGVKMSKSLGNFISLPVLNSYAEKYTIDGIRFFLMLNGPNDSTDSDFNDAKLQETYNAHLANALGNSCSRVISMIAKYFDSIVPVSEQSPLIDVYKINEFIAKSINKQNVFNVKVQIELGMSIIKEVDSFIHINEPYKLAKDPLRREELSLILNNAIEALRIASLLLWPIIPQKIEELWLALDYRPGFKLNDFDWGTSLAGHTIVEKLNLFPRA